MGGHGFLYDMTPIREVEPGWYKLKWKPIKNTYGHGGTYNFYVMKLFREHRSIGLMFHLDRGGVYGWTEYSFAAHFYLWWFDVNCWIKWNFVVSKEGPDSGPNEERRPLDLSGLIASSKDHQTTGRVR